MARRKTITDEQILQAARAVFLEEGFSAQTAKIAQRADVSEGTIFKRFPTKEALFFAALNADREVPWLAKMERQLGTGDIRENLLSLFVNIILYFNEKFPETMVDFWQPETASKLVPWIGRAPYRIHSSQARTISKG